MANVKLITIPKEGDKRKPRTQEFEQGLAEKVMRKSKNWKLPDDSKFVFKDGALIPKKKD